LKPTLFRWLCFVIEPQILDLLHKRTRACTSVTRQTLPPLIHKLNESFPGELRCTKKILAPSEAIISCFYHDTNKLP